MFPKLGVNYLLISVLSKRDIVCKLTGCGRDGIEKIRTE